MKPATRAAALAVVARLQAEIEAISGVMAPARVEDFLLDDNGRLAMGGAARAPEELLVVEDQGEVHVGLYLAEDLLAELATGDWTQAALEPLAAALEGVSHFVYLTWRAAGGGRVSQLELEAQAEVDKFAACLFALWRRGRREDAPALWERLFEKVRFREGLSGAEHERYRLANALAGAYCRLIAERASGGEHAERVLRELRRVYRLAAGEKLAALRSPLPA